MKKSVSFGKRCVALWLCVLLLCGLLLGSSALPVVAATEDIETFRADFSELTALVAADSFDANGKYRSTETDTAINNWISSRFGMYASRESKCYQERQYLGQGSYEIANFEDGGNDSWGGEYYWLIDKKGGLYGHAGLVSGEMMRKSSALTVKTANGTYATLKNFEASVVFNKAGAHNLGSVFISFHEDIPGRMTFSSNKLNAGNEAVILGNGPLTYVTGLRPTVPDGSYRYAYTDGIVCGGIANRDSRTVTEQFAASLDNSADYCLYVKVVNTTLTVRVTKVSDGSVVYTSESTIAAGEGFLSIGHSSSSRAFKSIEVTQLDDNGNPVDFGSTAPTVEEAAPFFWTVKNIIPYKSAKYTVSGADYYTYEGQTTAEAKTIIAALNNNFDLYHLIESRYVQAQHGVKQAYEGQTKDYGRFATVYSNNWLEYSVSSSGGNQNMRLINALVPKDEEGKQLAFKNFETTFQVRFETNADGPSAVFGGRQQEPGRFVRTYFGVNRQQALVVLTPLGISVGAGMDITYGHVSHVGIEGDFYDTNATATFDTPIPAKTPITVYVKAVGDQLTVKVTAGDITYYDATHTTIYEEVGTLAYGIANRKSHLGDIELYHLDENGERIALDEKTEIEAGMDADHFSLSFANLPGAEYKQNTLNGESMAVYTATANDNYIGTNYVAFSDLPTTEALDYISSKVDFYYNHKAHPLKAISAHGNDAANEGSGNWLLLFNNWIQRIHVGNKDQRMYRINTIVPKAEDDTPICAKNLYATFRVRFENGTDGENGNCTAVLGIRQSEPSKFVVDDKLMNTEQVVIALTQKSIAVAGGEDITAERFYRAGQFDDDAYGDVFSSALPQEVEVQVLAVEERVQVRILSLSGVMRYDAVFEVGYVNEGTVAFGISGRNGDLGELQVWRVNNRGARVDVDDETRADPTFADGKTRFVANFERLTNMAKDGYVTTEQDTLINEWVDDRFELYHDREDVFVARDYLGQSSDICDTTKDPYNTGYTYFAIGDGMLTRKSTKDGLEWMRKGDVLVPKTSFGIPARIKNFETTFTVIDTDHKVGAVAFSFRSDTPGKIVNRYQHIYQNQQAVIVGIAKNGSGLSVGGDFTSGASGDYYNADEKLSLFAALDRYKVYVKAVGENVTMRILSMQDVVLYEKKYTATSTEAGYLALGVYNGTKSIADWVITELDDNGNPVNFGKAQGENLFAVEDAKIRTFLNDGYGYELKAGSLLVKDANGQIFVPTRTDLKLNIAEEHFVYEVTDETAVAPFSIVDIQYVKPTLSTPNLDYVGTSYSAEKKGLRFVARLNRKELANGTEYLALEGQQCEVVDYGMLIATTKNLGDRELTVETAAADRYISNMSAKQRGVYYDVSAHTIDMSVCVTNIPAADKHARIIARAYVKYKLADGSEKTYYADPLISTYGYNEVVTPEA